jgi:putative sugar O-methyltransferase
MHLSVDNGFVDRKVDVDVNVINRVIKSYNFAKSLHKTASDVYQVGYMWLPIYQQCMQTVMAALSSEDHAKVANIYGNFFRESCTIGLHGMPVDMQTCYFSGNISEQNKGLYIADLMHRFSIWINSIGKSCPFEALATPDIGNPYGCYIDGKFYRAGVDYQHYYATIISRLTRSKKHRSVLELGGGFGGLAYFLIRDNPDITYIDADLPENMAVTAFHLLSAFPDKKIALFGEIDLKTADLSAFDAILIPNFAVEDLADNSVDLAFNSYSLAEMSPNTISNYAQHFSRISSKFIYHINHTSVSAVSADDFNFDLMKFELISRAPALWNLARNKDMDEYEYIYKAKTLNFS